MSNENNKSYRLGLDMGTNSLGWAIIELDDNDEPCGLIDAGVRIYSDGRNPKDSSSLAKGRRLARGLRRNRDRRLSRKQRLVELLCTHNLLPENDIAISENKTLNPYELRARAVGEVVIKKNKDGTVEEKRNLKPYELGRALLHICERRGFQSNRKTDLSDDEAKKESGKINTGSEELARRLKESGTKTLGQLLYHRHKKGKPTRVRLVIGSGYEFYPVRAMYKDEFECIKEFNHSMISDSVWDDIEEAIFFQRPLRPVDPGRCTLNPNEDRALKALPISQKFKVLQNLVNLKVETENEPTRILEDKEWAKLRDCLLNGEGLNKKGVLTWAKVKSLLNLHRSTRFNLENSSKDGLEGDITAHRMRGVLGSSWDGMDDEKQNDLVEYLYHEPSFEKAKQRVRDVGFNDEQAERLASKALSEGYMNLGVTALGKIVPELKPGVTYDKAAQKVGYDHSQFDQELRDELLYYGEVLERHAIGGDGKPHTKDLAKRYGRIANPTVHVGLNQLRLVINDMLKKYGKPKSVVVELARDLKASKDQKDEEKRRQEENRKKNDQRRADAEQILGNDRVSGRDIGKMRLWEEQGTAPNHCCPFCGKNISLHEVLSEATEIEHILPLSKTLDDSMANKVLAHSACNRKKGNHTPWEAVESDIFDENTILNSAAGLPRNKQWRFYEDAMDVFEERGGFLDRQLNETRYLSRLAREYLCTICKSVEVTPGQLTAMLRGKWGLHPDKVLRETNEPEEEVGKGKDRTDHRHHAIDAFVVGMTSRGLLQRVSTLVARNYGKDALLANFPEPWQGFVRDEFKDKMRGIVVSHRVDRTPPGKRVMTPGTDNTSGALHNETAYGLVNQGDIEDGKVNNKEVVHRVTLESLNKDGLEKIGHEPLKQALQKLYDKVEKETTDKKQVGKEFLKRARNPKGLSSVGYQGAPGGVHSVRVVEFLSGVVVRHGKNHEHYKVYKPDGNAFMDVFHRQHENEKGERKWVNFCVLRYDAAQRDFDEIYRRLREDNGIHPADKRIMRLYVNDLVEFENPLKNDKYQVGCIYKVQKMSKEELTLAPVNEANVDARHNDTKDVFNFLRFRGNNLADKLRVAGLKKARRNILGFESNTTRQ